jgi:hypothetical protein
MGNPSLAQFPIHLGLGATAVQEPAFTGDMQWYGGYVARHEADGAEVVLCQSGRLTLHQEHPDGRVNSITLLPGEYAINPPGVWHTADVTEPTTAVFITAGWGTQGRPRA